MWRNDTPPVDVVVDVWFWTEIRRARYDGARWLDVETGAMLQGAFWWRHAR